MKKVQVTVFETEDGRRFDNEPDAKWHELELKIMALINATKGCSYDRDSILEFVMTNQVELIKLLSEGR